MDNLRLILLLLGAVGIAAIYVWFRIQSQPLKGSRKSGSARAAARQSLADEPDDAAIQQELQRLQRVMSDQETDSGATDETLLLVLSVVAADQPFKGEALHKAFANNDLQFGERAIFHRLMRCDGKDIPVFSVANMVKPGDFGDRQLDAFSTPGITLFLQLPTVVEGMQAFDDFIHTAERLAVELGGQLRDAKHELVSHQVLMQIREKIASSEHYKRVTS